MKLAYSLLEVKSVNDEEWKLEGIATTPTPDRVDDVVEPKQKKSVVRRKKRELHGLNMRGNILGTVLFHFRPFSFLSVASTYCFCPYVWMCVYVSL